MKGFLKSISFILALLCMLGVFCLIVSCAPNEQINSYEYSLGKTTTENATYSFKEEISEKKRDRFVTFSEQLLGYLDSEAPLFQTSDTFSPSFIIDDDLKAPRAELDSSKLYFSTRNTKSVEFICYVLQGMKSNSLNYGLLYGLSANIYNELGWGKISTQSNSSIKRFLNKKQNRFILDLTYPLFHEMLTSKTEIKYAKSISIKLASYIENTHGRQAFKELFIANQSFDQTFDNLFCGYVNEWLNTIDIAKVQAPAEVLRWIPYTDYSPFKLVTESCEYTFNSEWIEDGLQTLFAYKDFKTNYASVRDFLIRTEIPLRKIREFFDFTPEIRVEVSLETSSYHAYTGGRNIITKSMAGISHEYVHCIVYQKFDNVNSWMLEGIAYYVSVSLDEIYSNDVLDLYQKTDEYKKAFKDVDGRVDHINHIQVILDDLLGLPIHENYEIRYHYAYIYQFHLEETNLYTSFDEYIYGRTLSIAFSDYLIATFGKEKYFELYKEGANYFKVYEKFKSEMIADFLEYLDALYN